jgi:phosphotransferase system HPr-like phosphotransfer protein
LAYLQPADEFVRTASHVGSYYKAMMEETMKIALAALMSVCLAGAALADDATCSATAKDKKLAGAALKSFMTKCEKDATAKCDADAKAKNLHGAAQTSFTKKCVKDASGA